MPTNADSHTVSSLQHCLLDPPAIHDDAVYAVVVAQIDDGAIGIPLEREVLPADSAHADLRCSLWWDLKSANQNRLRGGLRRLAEDHRACELVYDVKHGCWRAALCSGLERRLLSLCLRSSARMMTVTIRRPLLTFLLAPSLSSSPLPVVVVVVVVVVVAVHRLAKLLTERRRQRRQHTDCVATNTEPQQRLTDRTVLWKRKQNNNKVTQRKKISHVRQKPFIEGEAKQTKKEDVLVCTPWRDR